MGVYCTTVSHHHLFLTQESGQRPVLGLYHDDAARALYTASHSSRSGEATSDDPVRFASLPLAKLAQASSLAAALFKTVSSVIQDGQDASQGKDFT